MCLLVGSPGVGKTLLLKRLHGCSHKNNYSHLDEAPATIPTVGTNLVNVITNKRSEVTIRELGGCMAPIWHKYYDQCPALMFMIDSANRCQIAASCIQLIEVLKDPALRDTNVLIILNKVDILDCMTRQELNFLMRLGDVLEHAPQKIQIEEVSAQDGQGLINVAQWIQENVKPNS